MSSIYEIIDVEDYFLNLKKLAKRMDMPHDLVDVCKKFIDDNNIYYPETIYQRDSVILNALEFIEKICDVVGYAKQSEE